MTSRCETLDPCANPARLPVLHMTFALARGCSVTSASICEAAAARARACRGLGSKKTCAGPSPRSAALASAPLPSSVPEPQQRSSALTRMQYDHDIHRCFRPQRPAEGCQSMHDTPYSDTTQGELHGGMPGLASRADASCQEQTHLRTGRPAAPGAPAGCRPLRSATSAAARARPRPRCGARRP